MRMYMRIEEWFTSRAYTTSIIKSKICDTVLQCHLTSPRAILSQARAKCGTHTRYVLIIKISLYVDDCAIMQIIAHIHFRLSAPVVVTAGLQADHCIIMQITSLVNTKNVRTTPPADNHPIVLFFNRLDHHDLAVPDLALAALRTPAIDATRVLRDLVAPDASPRRAGSKRGCLCYAVYGKCVTWRGCFSMLSLKLTQHFASTGLVLSQRK